MKELGIIINKILKDWLQSKGEGDIVFTDDIAINEVTDEIVSECHKEYDEAVRQRDELKEENTKLKMKLWAQNPYPGRPNPRDVNPYDSRAIKRTKRL